MNGQLRPAMKRHGICVLLPTYNNAGTLHDVVSAVLEHCDDVIVVDDGSTDGTRQILEAFGESITVVRHASNRGKGAALLTGFRKAADAGFSTVITMDTDGQHYAGDIPAFVRAVIGNPGKIIVGERNLDGVDINGKSSFANKFSNFWFRLQTFVPLRDTQTGFRAYPLESLRWTGMVTGRYEAELELMVYSAWHGTRFKSIPIRVYYPPRHERVSHFRPGWDFARISLLNFILCMTALGYGYWAMLVRAVLSRRLFGFEFTPFTHRKGKRREASLTLGRICRSIYALAYYVSGLVFVYLPRIVWDFKITKPSPGKFRRLHRMIRTSALGILRRLPGSRVSIKYHTDVDLSRPCMIVANHQSQIDLPCMMALNEGIVFLVKDWVWKNPLVGPIVREAGFVNVDHGFENNLDQLREKVAQGYSIAVFPEGTRSSDGTPGRFHQGAFYMARELGLDIVPVAISGTGRYMGKDDVWFRKADITCSVLQPLRRDRLQGLTLRQEASAAKEAITAALDPDRDGRWIESLVMYKYAWRGWHIVAQAKKALRTGPCSLEINASRVIILNSGIGTMAIYWALKYGNVKFIACECSEDEHRIAAATAGIPSNLEFVNPVGDGDFPNAGPDDMVIRLGGDDAIPQRLL